MISGHSLKLCLQVMNRTWSMCVFGRYIYHPYKQSWDKAMFHKERPEHFSQENDEHVIYCTVRLALLVFFCYVNIVHTRARLSK